MSEPTPLKNMGGYWSCVWSDPRKPGEKRGRARMKRFGRCSKVTRTEAMRRFKRWMLEEYPALAKAGVVKYSVDQLCHDYYDEMQKRYVVDGKHTTSINRIRIALDSFRAKYGVEEADDVTAGMVAGWIEGYIHERKTKTAAGKTVVSEAEGGVHSPILPLRTRRDSCAGSGHNSGGDSGASKPRTKETCNLALTYIKRMYRWGAKYDLVSDSVAGSVHLCENLRSDHVEVRHKDRVLPVAWETVKATKAHCPPKVQSLLDVLWFTGMRPGEALMMRPCDIEKSGDVRVYTPRHHKTSHKGKVRKIVLGPRAWAIIEPLLPDRMDALVFEYPSWKNSGNFAGYLERRCKRAGVPKWTANMIRHSHATRVEDEFGAEATQAVLGHSSLGMQKVYVEKSLRLAAEVARKTG